jgi:peptidoglycan/LPS O-acetylase OafA/YrhL
LEIVTKISYPDSYVDFYPLYATAQGHWCREDCMIVPTWNHMWFVAYLLVYSLILCAVLALRPSHGQDVSPRALPSQIGPAFLILPWLYLWAARYWLLPVFGITHALVNDFYAHASYGALFLLGFMIAKNEIIFDTAARFRHLALIFAVAGYSGVLYVTQMPAEQYQSNAFYPIFGRGAHELQAWAAIIALLGYAKHHLADADGPWRRWLTKAVFPFYIIHQTVIVVAAYQLDRLALPLPIEVSILLCLTFAACFATAWIASRLKPLGVVLGWAP